MTNRDDALKAIFNKYAERHGRGRDGVQYLAHDVFNYPGECQDISELQARVVAQLAGLIEGLVDYGVLDDADTTEGVLFSVMRSVSDG